MFRLKTAAPPFQILMDEIVEETKIEGLYNYQDDILTGAHSFQETVEKHSTVFKF